VVLSHPHLQIQLAALVDYLAVVAEVRMCLLAHLVEVAVR
jgi:hypothetical protein